MKMSRETYKNSLFLLKNFKKIPVPEITQWDILYDYFDYINQAYEIGAVQRFVWKIHIFWKKNDVRYLLLTTSSRSYK